MTASHLKGGVVDYAAELKKRLPPSIFEPVPRRLWWLAAYLFFAVAGIAAISFYTLPIWLNLLVALVIGSSFSGLAFLGHEILHGAVVGNSRWRNFFGGICMFSFCLSTELWRKWHVSMHHGYAQEQEYDPDIMPTKKLYEQKGSARFWCRLPGFVRSALLLGSFTFWLSRQIGAKFVRYTGQEDKPLVRRLMWTQTLIPLLAWIALGIVIGIENFIFAYLIPLVIANVTMNSYIVTNHGLSPAVRGDSLRNTLSVTTPWPMSLLHLQFGFHVEHHIFPSMSAVHAPRVKKLLEELWPDKYKTLSLLDAVRRILGTPQFYDPSDSRYFVDPISGKRYPTLGTT